MCGSLLTGDRYSQLNNSQIYRLQIVVKGGAGFEFLTVMSEQALVDEIVAAKAGQRMARIETPNGNAEFANCQFLPEQLTAYVHIAVQRVARA